MATSSRFIVVVFAPDNPFCDGRWEVCPCRRRLTGGGCKDGPALQLGGTLPPQAPQARQRPKFYPGFLNWTRKLSAWKVHWTIIFELTSRRSTRAPTLHQPPSHSLSPRHLGRRDRAYNHAAPAADMGRLPGPRRAHATADRADARVVDHHPVHPPLRR